MLSRYASDTVHRPCMHGIGLDLSADNSRGFTILPDYLVARLIQCSDCGINFRFRVWTVIHCGRKSVFSSQFIFPLLIILRFSGCMSNVEYGRRMEFRFFIQIILN